MSIKKVLTLRLCQICNSETHNQKFCSNKCVAEFNRIRLTGMVSPIKGIMKLPRESRNCKYCNSMMVVRETSTRKYCSRRCKEIGIGLARRGKVAWNRGLPNVNNKWYAVVKAGYREDLGHFVRSSWEADFARLWKYLKAPYEYEKHRFDLDEFGTYCPDFYLPERNIFYEIKGRMPYLETEMRLKKLYEKYQIEVAMVTEANFKWLLVWIRDNLPDLFNILENKKLINKNYDFDRIKNQQHNEWIKFRRELKLEKRLSSNANSIENGV